MTLILFILLLVLGLEHRKLSNRVNSLETQIKQLMKNPNEILSVPNNANVIPVPNQLPEPELPTSSSVFVNSFEPTLVKNSHSDITQVENNQSSEFFLITWFKENTLIKIGSVIFFLGAVWLVSYAFISDWLSPVALIGLGFLLAVSVYILADWRKNISVPQYVILTALGTGIVSATVFSAQIILTFFTPALSLSLLAMSLFYTMYVAWKTESKKLAVAVAVAGLSVPTLIGVFFEPIWLLSYLFVLSLGVLFVALKMELRVVTLLLIFGTSCYEIGLSDLIEQKLLWVFAVLFSLVFFVSVTISFVKTKEANTLDISSLTVISLAFILFASELTFSPGLVTLVATVVVSGVGYFLLSRGFPTAVAAVYIAFASVLLLVATSFIFNGYTEVLVFVVEITSVFIIATYLGLPERVVRLIALGYLLPLFASISSFGSDNWESGVWHTDALILLAVPTSLVLSALWLIHKRTIAVYGWSGSFASIFLVVGFFYTLAVVGQFMNALFGGETALVMTYVVWALMSVVGTYYAVKLQSSNKVIILLASTLIFPYIVSMVSFTADSWFSGIFHIHGFGVGVMIVFLLLMTLLFTQLFCVEYNSTLRRFLGIMIIALVTYLFIGVSPIYEIMFGSQLAIVASYSTYMLILYGLISLFVALRVNTVWLGTAILTLVLPLFLALNSFDINGWSKADIPQAMGLFVCITLLVLIALGIRNRYHSENAEIQKRVLRWSTFLLVTASIYVVGYLWSLSHSILDGEKAVTLALFIYTVVGLFMYQYGNKVGKNEIRRGGQILLAFVVLRLLMVDIWEMELLWRIVTFLGIGILFIATALFEKSKRLK